MSAYRVLETPTGRVVEIGPDLFHRYLARLMKRDGIGPLEVVARILVPFKAEAVIRKGCGLIRLYLPPRKSAA